MTETQNTSSATTPFVYTITVGGAAGDGVREAGINFSEFLNELGYKTFSSFDYPSLIRGGHNYSRISYSIEPIHADYHELDVLVATNAESVHIHKDEMKKDSFVFVEEVYASELGNLGLNLIPVPMKKIAEELKAPQVARTSSAFGAYGYILGIPLNRLKLLADKVYANVGSEINVALVERGYNYVKSKGYKQKSIELPTSCEDTGEVIDGNKAIAKGFLAAGLEAYVGYPMTPSTSTLAFLAKVGKKRGLKVVHPEDEIAVINMALGMSYAGKRVAIGTANGGFALMQEAFSLAGVSEIPIAIMVSMRTGPATGVATHTSQGDLQFILHAGHGEFPRHVVAPGDVEECFTCAADALNLAWKYQIPAVVLSDKHLSESYKSVQLDIQSKGPDTGKRAVPVDGHYLRYKITDDGISPIAFPGKRGIVVKATSYEHNEEGEATEDPKKIRTMQDKRYKKLEGLYCDFAWFPTVKTYGDLSSDVVVVFWGSTKGAVLEAQKYLKRPAKLVQILWMEPFDADRIKRELGNAKIIIDVEANHTAQLAALIREKTSIEIFHKILKYDSLPFTPTELANDINRFI